VSTRSRPPSPDEEGTAPDGAAGVGSEAGQAPDQSARRLVLTAASEIDPEPVIWAWEDDGAGRIPAGSLGLFAGREGTGKSSFLIWLAAQITTGSLPGSFAGQPRGVIYVAVEDSWKYTIVPRLEAAGADRDLVYQAEVRTAEDGTVSLSLPVDNDLLKNEITKRGIALVALDPLMSAISGSLDTHVNREVRQALDPLARMADETGAIVAGIAHFNKSGGTDASSLITASGAFKDVARFIFAFAEDPETGDKVITQTKNSLGHSGLPSLAYRIVEATVPTAKGDARVGRFVLDGESDKSVGEILRSVPDRDDDDKTRADDYLKMALAGGPRRTTEVEEEAKQAHGISKRTLERARTRLGIAAGPRPSGPAAKDGKRKAEWWIALPEHAGDLREPYKDPDDQAGESANTASTKDALTCEDRKTANAATLQGVLGGAGGLATDDAITNTASTAKSPGGLAEWRSGGLERDDAGETVAEPDRDLGYLGGVGLSKMAARTPPCDASDPRHAACWDLSDGWLIHDGRCTTSEPDPADTDTTEPASQDACTVCSRPLESFDTLGGSSKCQQCQTAGAA
jgi:hypothetical protein